MTTSIHGVTIRVNVPQDQLEDDITLTKLLQKHWQGCFAWHDLPLRPPREHLCFFISDTTRVTPGQTINTGLKTRSPLLLGLGGSVGLSILSDTK